VNQILRIQVQALTSHTRLPSEQDSGREGLQSSCVQHVLDGVGFPKAGLTRFVTYDGLVIRLGMHSDLCGKSIIRGS
jgi:hypothetical protein